MLSLPHLRKLKRVIIKEELMALTGDATKAILLDQFIEWSQQTHDFNAWMAEEETRAQKEGRNINIPLTDGWIYKTASKLSQQSMLGLSPQSIRRHLSEIVAMGYLDERDNPNYKWDRTKQYRVNLLNIQRDLHDLGYPLNGYALTKADSTPDIQC